MTLGRDLLVSSWMLIKNDWHDILVPRGDLSTLYLEPALRNYNFHFTLRLFDTNSSISTGSYWDSFSICLQWHAIGPDSSGSRYRLTSFNWSLRLSKFQNLVVFTVFFEGFDILKIYFWIDGLKSVDYHISLESKIFLSRHWGWPSSRKRLYGFWHWRHHWVRVWKGLCW